MSTIIDCIICFDLNIQTGHDVANWDQNNSILGKKNQEGTTVFLLIHRSVTCFR